MVTGAEDNLLILNGALLLRISLDLNDADPSLQL